MVTDASGELDDFGCDQQPGRDIGKFASFAAEVGPISIGIVSRGGLGSFWLAHRPETGVPAAGPVASPP